MSSRLHDVLAGYSAEDKVLFITGAGTQYMLSKSPDLQNSSVLREIFKVDKKLDFLCKFSSSYAVLSLNVTWPFPNTFPFHGTITRGDVVDVNGTGENVQPALQHLKRSWETENLQDVPILVCFIGVGLSACNGTGLKTLFTYLHKIKQVIVVDNNKVLSDKRKNWLINTFEKSVVIKHIFSSAEEFLHDVQLPVTTKWQPTAQAFRNAYGTGATMYSVAHADTVVLNLLQKFFIRLPGILQPTVTRRSRVELRAQLRVSTFFSNLARKKKKRPSKASRKKNHRAPLF
jgi:hypothetical protein